jgi:hypothetical protein
MTITNNPKASGSAFTLDMGQDSATTNQVQKVALTEPAGGTFITPAQDGTDATGVSPPAGASGIRGWLSSIWNKLNTSIAVTGTFWQAIQPVSGTFWQATQPISAASLPLPAGAGTAANQASQLTQETASATALGTPADAAWTSGAGSAIALLKKIAAASEGASSMPVVVPVVTSNGAYAAGNEIGGLMTFPVGGSGTGGTLMSMRVTSRTAALTTPLMAFVFTTIPAASTWTDKTAPAINTADIASILCAVPLSNPIGGLGTMTIWNAGNIGMQFLAANLYVVIVTVSAITLASTSASDLTVELGM